MHIHSYAYLLQCAQLPSYEIGLPVDKDEHFLHVRILLHLFGSRFAGSTHSSFGADPPISWRFAFKDPYRAIQAPFVPFSLFIGPYRAIQHPSGAITR